MRKDGKRVKNNVSGMYQVIPYIMKKRYDAQNMITLHLPQEPLKAYLAEKRAQGMQISYMAIIIAAYLRTAAEFPALNRFIVNKRIYAQQVHRQHGDHAPRCAGWNYDEVGSELYRYHYGCQ